MFSVSLPYVFFDQFFCDLSFPVLVGSRACGAGVEDFRCFDAHGISRFDGALIRKTAHTDNFFGFQDFEHLAEMDGAGIEEGLPEFGREFVRR